MVSFYIIILNTQKEAKTYGNQDNESSLRTYPLPDRGAVGTAGILRQCTGYLTEHFRTGCFSALEGFTECTDRVL